VMQCVSCARWLSPSDAAAGRMRLQRAGWMARSARRYPRCYGCAAALLRGRRQDARNPSPQASPMRFPDCPASILGALPTR
jgi:hypothetical protein